MQTLYPILLSFHNIMRWVVLILGLLAIIRSYLGWIGKRQYSETDRKAGVFYSVSLDVQLLLGLLLYFISPITKQVFADFSLLFGDPGSQIAFFGMEHVFAMILAVVLAHVGSALSRKPRQGDGQFRRAAIWYTLSFLLILVGMPWFRPLFRL
jgi:hypothetical protein